MALHPDLHDLLEAVLDRVLPGDDGPGASEAGVVHFVTWYLTQHPFDVWSGSIERGLRLLDSLAVDRYHAMFLACSAAERDQVIQALVLIPQPGVQQFMQRLVKLAIKGFLSDPKYGGNRGGAGWRYVGFEPRA